AEAIMAVRAPEKPVSPQICSAAARMRASLICRRRSRRLAAPDARSGASPLVFRFATLPPPPPMSDIEVDRLVRLSLAFLSRPTPGNDLGRGKPAGRRRRFEQGPYEQAVCRRAYS